MKNSWIDKAGLVLLALFPFALLSSMAAMEMLSWTLLGLALIKSYKLTSEGSFKALLRELSIPGADIPVWGFAATVILGALVFGETGQERWQIIGAVRWILLLYAYRLLLPPQLEKNWETWLLAIFCFIFLIGAYSALQFSTGMEFTRSRQTVSPYGQYFRAVGFFSMALTFSAILGMWGMVALSSVLRNSRQIIAWMGAVGAVMAVVFSLSRGAYIALAATVVPVLFLVRRSWAVASLIVFALLVAAAVATNPILRTRITSISDLQDESNSVRLALWHTNFEIMKDHPLIGVGLARNKLYLEEYYKRLGYGDLNFYSHAHSNPMQILAGTGLIGMGFWLWMCLWFLRAAFLVWKRMGTQHRLGMLGLGAFSAQVYFHLAGLTETSFTDGEVNHNLVFFWALTAALSCWRKRE